MKIMFDHQIFTMQSYGGVSRYFVRLVEGLISLGEDPHVVAPYHRNRYLSELPVDHVQGVELKRFLPKTTRLMLVINHLLCSNWNGRHKPDLVHETYYTSKPVKGGTTGRLLTVYDMIHEKFRNEFPSNDPVPANKKAALARADHIISISHSTKDDLCEIYDVPPEKISVVHLGSDDFSYQSSEPVAGSSNRPFLLYVGDRRGYKNFGRMVRAVASRSRLAREFDIIAFGGGAFSKSELKLFNKLGFRSNAVQHLEGGDEVLGPLYRSAAAFVYPSLYEGFGLPPLEAMAHDCAVVSSITSSMPEVIGDAGEYFEPMDIDAQGEAIERVVFDDHRRNQLIRAGRKRLSHFSWRRCATETRDIYRKVIQERERV